MKVSIITAAYNSGRTIRFCINSVVAQTYHDIEHVIIDGGSKDDTVAVVKEFHNRQYILVSERDNGIYDAMNKGIHLATGDVIAILNSDDFYADNDVISDVVKVFEQNPGSDMVYGDLEYVKQDDTEKVVRVWNSEAYYDRFFEDGNVPPHPCLFIRKKVYETAGSFNLKYKLAADYELMLRVFIKYHFQSVYIHRLIVKMRLGGATNKSIKNIINGNREILRSWKDNQLSAPIMLMPLKVVKRIKQFF